jgi:hypothetical protein
VAGLFGPEGCRLAKQLLWATIAEGSGRRGWRANPMLPQVYAARLETIGQQLAEARQQ